MYTYIYIYTRLKVQEQRVFFALCLAPSATAPNIVGNDGIGVNSSCAPTLAENSDEHVYVYISLFFSV